MIGGEQLVAALEVERAQHGIEAGGGIRHEGQVVRIGAHERSKLASRRVQGRLEVMGEEEDRLGLHPFAPRLLGGEHRARSGTVRAVVEEGDGRVQGPVPCELGGHRGLS